MKKNGTNTKNIMKILTNREKKMKNYKFVEHTGNTCPVDPETMVVYRTTSVATPVSHIHHPVKAGEINWTNEEQYMGSILEYARYIPKVKYIHDESIIDTFDGHR